MKKLFLLLCLMTAVNVQAQHKAFQFGFKGSANVGWFKTDVDNYDNDGVQMGGSWGLVADIFLMENYSITTGFDVLYINGGMTARSTSPDPWKPVEGKIYDKFKTKYIQLPLVLTMKTNTIKDKFRIYGQIGYGLGFLYGAKREHKFISDAGMTLQDSSGDYDGFTLSRSAVIFGLGVEIPLFKSTFLRTGFEFNNAFVDMVKDDLVKARSNFVSFQAAVLF